jgi:hypothetical protein
MTKITYHIVEHDGGWAYKVDGVFSEPFPSHDLARKAAERAAREQHVPGETRAAGTRSWPPAPTGRKPKWRAEQSRLYIFRRYSCARHRAVTTRP